MRKGIPLPLHSALLLLGASALNARDVRHKTHMREDARRQRPTAMWGSLNCVHCALAYSCVALKKTVYAASTLFASVPQYIASSGVSTPSLRAFTSEHVQLLKCCRWRLMAVTSSSSSGARLRCVRSDGVTDRVLLVPRAGCCDTVMSARLCGRSLLLLLLLLL